MQSLSLFDYTKTEVRCVLVSNPIKMTIIELARDYRKIIGKPIPFFKLGYKDLIFFLRDIPDIVKVTGLHPRTATLTPVIGQRLVNLNNLIIKQKVAEPKLGENFSRRETRILNENQVNRNLLETIPEESSETEISSITFQDLAEDDACIEPKISDKIREQLKTLIEQFPNGLPVRLLAQSYKDIFGEILDFKELGFECALQFCNWMTELWYIMVPKQSVEYFLIDITKQPLKETKYENNVKCSKSKSEPPKSSISNSLPAGDIMTKHDGISSLITLLKSNEGKLIKILISEIYDPMRFWFVLYQRNHYEKLFEVMDDMREFYEGNHGSFFIPKNEIVSDTYCAVCLSGIWQRAYIVYIIDELRVKVYLIDFGPIVVTHKTNVFYLLKKYQSFPRQACRGRSDLIMPPNKKKVWDLNTTKQFVCMVTEKLLLARLTRVDEAEGVTWMVIKTDDKKNSNLSINECLVIKGQAKICLRSKNTSTNFQNMFD